MKMTEKGFSQYRLWKLSGVSQPTIKRILDGESKEPDKSTVVSLAKALGCTYAYLYDGKEGGNVAPGPDLAQKIPLISWVQAGAFCESPDVFLPGDAEDWIPCPTRHGPSTYALAVRGDSMTSPYPGQRSYPAGIIIFVDPDRVVENGSRVIAKDPETGEVTFKVYVEDSGRRFLKPINPAYPSIPITGEIGICGVVIGSFMPE